jgi:hypothetical protein
MAQRIWTVIAVSPGGKVSCDQIWSQNFTTRAAADAAAKYLAPLNPSKPPIVIANFYNGKDGSPLTQDQYDYQSRLEREALEEVEE